MKGLKKILTSVISKYGNIIASCAFMAVIVAANSSCSLPYYEPEEPEGLAKFKKYN